MLEEFGPQYVHVRQQDYVVADALSQIDIKEKESDNLPVDEIRWFRPSAKQREQALVTCQCLAMLSRDETAYEDDELLDECFTMPLQGGLTEQELEQYPMSPRIIAKAQKADKGLQKAVAAGKKEYTIAVVEGHKLLRLNERIVVPQILRKRIINWVHTYLQHPGHTRMEKTIGELFTWANMRDDIRRYVKGCHKCQLCKTSAKKYGKLPLKTAEPATPWRQVNVDLIGPYSVKVKGAKNKTVQLRAMTMIDPATGWFEVKEIDDATSETVQAAFDDTWLSRYPKPQILGFDNGGEFKKIFNEVVFNMDLE